MSWHCSRALVAAYSEVNCSDGQLSAQLNTTPMPDQFYWPDKTTEHSRLSRFGMTCVPLTANLGADLLTWYLAAFPAKTLAQPVKAQESTESAADCGLSSQGSLARYDHATHSLKTAQCSLLEDLTEFCPTLPRWGSMRNGALYQRQIAVRHTSVSEFGYEQKTEFFATPTTMDKLPPKSPEALNREATIARPGRSKPANLRDQVSNMKNWPTPVASDVGIRKTKYAQGGTALSMAVTMWPTPTAHNAKETNAPSESARNTPTLAAQAGGSLNPPWVEWLMGWVIGWTDLQPLAMDKFQLWRQQHGDC